MIHFDTGITMMIGIQIKHVDYVFGFNILQKFKLFWAEISKFYFTDKKILEYLQDIEQMYITSLDNNCCTMPIK